MMNVFILYMIIKTTTGVVAITPEVSFRTESKCIAYAKKIEKDLGYGRGRVKYSCMAQ